MLTPNTSPKELARLLGTTYGKIIYFYYKLNKDYHYKSFEIPKKSGGTREIDAPTDQLRNLQGKLAELLILLYTPKIPAKAFIKERSILDNAKPHTKKSFVFNIDIEDFFPSISFARVRGLLSSPPYNLALNTATVIAHLATYNGRLPQGAPTSPVLSNMICKSLDNKLLSLARKNSCTYTRYADDITFSFRQSLGNLPSDIVTIGAENGKYYGEELGSELSNIIKDNRFRVKSQKTRLQGKRNRQVVTGLIVNKIANVDRKFVRKTAAMIHSIEVSGAKIANEKFKQAEPEKTCTLERHIFGRLLFIKQIKGVESSVYHRLAIRFNNLPIESNVPTVGKKLITYPTSKEQSSQFTERCWVIEVEGNDPESTMEPCMQGTAFMIHGGQLITCAHLFTKIKDGKQPVDFEDLTIKVFKIHKQSEKFEVIVDKISTHHDIAVLRFPDPIKKTHKNLSSEFFQIETENQIEQGEKVTILGFPDVKQGTYWVNRFWPIVTNKYVKSTVTYYEVDKDIKAGNSGGPVLNSSLRVVGIAATGISEGNVTTSFIDIKHLQDL